MKITNWIQKKREEQKGFTLLFAVLVSTLIVAIAATVASIAVRQTILSGTSRESQYAFYAANTVLECVFFWDVVGVEGLEGKVFPGPNDTALAVNEMGTVNCSGGNLATGDGFEDGEAFATGWNRSSPTVTTVKIEIFDVVGNDPELGHRYCAEATISKSELPDGSINTTIQAKGYNTCDLDNPRAVERGLVQSYQS